MTNIHRYKECRSWPVYAMAASVSVSMAAARILKLELLLFESWTLLGPARATYHVFSQFLILLSSLLLAFCVPLPRVPWAVYAQHNIVFKLYINQLIMTSGLAAICCHLHRDNKSTRAQIAARVLCLVALINVLFFLEGRTGYFDAVSGIAAGLFWEMSQQWLALLIPFSTVCLAMLAFPHCESRVQLDVTEFMDYKGGEASPSAIAVTTSHSPALA